MATDGSDPEPCDPEILRNGEVVFKTDTIPSNAMEDWVREVAQKSGQRVDWCYQGGIAFVLALGDIDAVKRAIDSLETKIIEIRNREIEKLEEIVGPIPH